MEDMEDMEEDMGAMEDMEDSVMEADTTTLSIEIIIKASTIRSNPLRPLIILEAILATMEGELELVKSFMDNIWRSLSNCSTAATTDFIVPMGPWWRIRKKSLNSLLLWLLKMIPMPKFLNKWNSKATRPHRTLPHRIRLYRFTLWMKQ